MSKAVQILDVIKINNKDDRKFYILLISFLSSSLVSMIYLNYEIRTAFAIIITISFIFLILTNYKLSIEVYIALTYLIPFSSRILLYYIQSVPQRDILMGIQDLLLGLIILGYIIKQLYYKRRLIKDRIDWFVLAYIGWNLIEIFNSNTNIILGIYAARVTILPMFMYFIAREYFYNFNDIKRFLKIILFFSISDILYGLVQILFGFTPFDLYSIQQLGLKHIWIKPGFIGFNKIFSLSGGSYNLFYPLAIFTILFLGFNKQITTFFKIDRLKKIFLLLVFIIFSSLIERTPIVMLVIGYLITRINFRSVKSFLKVAIIFVMLYSLLNFFVPLLEKTGKFQFHRFAELVRPFAAETIEGRKQTYWHQAKSFISKRSILGYGLGQFTSTSEAYRQDKYLIAPHSMYYTILLRSGLIGLMLFIALFLAIFKELFFYIKKNYYFVGFVKALTGITVAVLLAGYANLPLEYHLGIFFWFFYGFFILLKNKELSREIFRHPIDCRS